MRAWSGSWPGGGGTSAPPGVRWRESRPSWLDAAVSIRPRRWTRPGWAIDQSVGTRRPRGGDRRDQPATRTTCSRLGTRSWGVTPEPRARARDRQARHPPLPGESGGEGPPGRRWWRSCGPRTRRRAGPSRVCRAARPPLCTASRGPVEYAQECDARRWAWHQERAGLVFQRGEEKGGGVVPLVPAEELVPQPDTASLSPAGRAAGTQRAGVGQITARWVAERRGVGERGWATASWQPARAQAFPVAPRVRG